MNKVLLASPAMTNSGYGCHSREILESIERMDNVDLMISLMAWGNCSWLSYGDIKERIIRYSQKNAQYQHSQKKEPIDCVIHVTVPTEFEKHYPCPYICVTAGIESDRISPEWLLKVNQQTDHLVVPSQFVADQFKNASFIAQNTVTLEEKRIGLEKPITVIPESVDTNVFNNKVECKLDMNFEPDFCFISTGQWGTGNVGDERKNISHLIKWFKEAFKGRKDVGLVLKANMTTNSLIDKEATVRRINDLKLHFNLLDYPKIYLIHDYITSEQMAQLYRHPKVKAYITLTHGEGYGRPIIEAAACDLPIMAPDWSGHKEFLDKGKFVKFRYQLADVPPMHIGNLFCKGSKWANVEEDDVKRRMKQIVENYSIPRDWATDLGKVVRETYNLDVIHNTWKDFFVSNRYIDPEKGKEGFTAVTEYD